MIPEKPRCALGNITKSEVSGRVCDVGVNVTTAGFNHLALSWCSRKAGGQGVASNPILPVQQPSFLGTVYLVRTLAITYGQGRNVESCSPTALSVKFSNCFGGTRALTLTGRHNIFLKSHMLAGGAFTG